jgi:putative hemolysin
MNLPSLLTLAVLLCILTLAAYVDRIYSEMGKFLAREYQDNIDSWEQLLEPRLRLGREAIALSASILRQLSLAAIAFLFGSILYTHDTVQALLFHSPGIGQVGRAAAELILLLLVFDRLIPQILFTRTRGTWVTRLRYLLLLLFYLVQPVVLALGLLLSIAALAEPEDQTEEEHPSEAMDALLEAGEEEGILEESDRELVRSVVEFGDKLVREVMTPRPEIFAVPGTLTLQQFTAAIEEHAFSRVPVYATILDEITGIAFAHDLLQVLDTDANSRTVAEMQRPAAFVPETKNVAELLREMQREKQHMRLVIDEYGGVAGLITIEDLLEAIVGEINDEHDTPEDQDLATVAQDGSIVVSGTFEIPHLRDLLLDQLRSPPRAEALPMERKDPQISDPAVAPVEEDVVPSLDDIRDDPREDVIQRLGDGYEATTLGGLVSEMAGHIPHPGEVVEENGVRFQVLAATDRRIDRIRITLAEASRAE